MKLIQCILFLICTLSPALVSAQAVGSQPQSRLVETEPFRIKPGSTFAASSPGKSPRGGSASSAITRARIIADLREAEAIIAENYVDVKKPRTAAMTGSLLSSMLHTLDPHSNYFDAADWKELLDEQQSGYAGIGTSIGSFQQDGTAGTFVISTFPGSPARRAGLRFGDRVIAVNGQSTADRSTDAVRDRIRGAAGTTVRLTIERAGSNRPETIEIKRGIVAQPSIPDFYLLQPGVGYIDLSEGFNYTTDDEFTAALNSLHRQGMTSLVLDLRGNGGGIVDQAVRVVEKFLPAGSLIVSQRGRTVTDSREWRSANPSPETMPLVLLVDENTASASEIVAGALQDSDRALIVGQKTFGKGLVQNVIDLPQNTGLTLTAARYYTPSGRSIQRDYSEIGQYDYFNHRGPAAAIGTPYYETRTVTDRKVFGGDGIAPDESVTKESLTASQAALIDPIFLFVREMAGGRISGFPSPEKPEISRKRLGLSDLPVSEALVEQFSEYVKTMGSIELSEETLRNEAQFIKTRLRYDLALAMFGSVTATQVLTDHDREVAAAVKLLPRAGQLSSQASRLLSRTK